MFPTVGAGGHALGSRPATPHLVAQIMMTGETAKFGEFRPARRSPGGAGTLSDQRLGGRLGFGGSILKKRSTALIVVNRPIAQARAGKLAALRLGPTGPAFSSFSSQCAGMLSRKADSSKLRRGWPAAIRS